ncbi:hypothetical protein Rleg2_1119 [Rhizobium leguminosarum bv. trifolii WSM2304]|uniref:Uncharacterized protein n=1 Tax=Rhizobium leguminosarum bv. trifolii (strain WSM2304) TaxID=395492 RepID=A0ABF7QK64_RHILW|nr:hypothetical protein [Rhizobium leguminosarum]ACI54413.1 hypothetical protein Rleg2_1119 [Rhizobium leguminosarum bv. trifolii WSM2304]
MKVTFHKAGPDAPSLYHFKVTSSRVTSGKLLEPGSDTIVVLLDDLKNPYRERELELIVRIVSALTDSTVTSYDY